MEVKIINRDLRKCRAVNGPLPGDIGHIIKTRQHGELREQLLQGFEDIRKKEAAVKRLKFELKMDKIFNDHRKRFDLLTLRSSINRLVNLSLEEVDKTHEIKKNKLKVLLLNDESKMIYEYTEKAQHEMDRILEMENEEAEAIAYAATKKDDEIAQKIYDEMAIRNSDEYIAKLRLENDRNTFMALEEQIRQKLNAKKAKDSIDKIWDEINDAEHIKVENIKNQKVENALKTRREYFDSLKMQIEDKQRLREHELCIENTEESWRQKIQKKWTEDLNKKEEMVRTRRAMHNEELQKQLEASQLTKEHTLADDIRLQSISSEYKKMLDDSSTAELSHNKMLANNELAIFKEAITQYRNSMAAEQERMESLDDNERIKQELEKIDNTRKVNARRKTLAIECSKFNKQMAIEKAKKQQSLTELEKQYFQLMKFNVEKNERLDKVCPIYPYAVTDTIPYLRKQDEYSEVLKSRAKSEEEANYSTQLTESTNRKERIRQLINNPFNENMGRHPHPFYGHLQSRTQSQPPTNYNII